jgi:ABC-type polar amino acid transport system ATPase subunit
MKKGDRVKIRKNIKRKRGFGRYEAWPISSEFNHDSVFIVVHVDLPTGKVKFIGWSGEGRCTQVMHINELKKA